jgi:hypothetical protein
MPRQYGYGAAMGAYFLDHVDNWSGDRGFITHARLRYTFPVLVGDVARLNGRVDELDPEAGTCELAIEMTNRSGNLMASGEFSVRFL